MKRNKQADLIRQMTDKEVLHALYLTQFLLLLLSLIIGSFVFEDLKEFYRLFKWSFADIVIWGGGAGLLVVAMDLYLMKKLPEKYYDDGGINNRLFTSRSVAEIFLIAFLVAVSEEIFFRGMVQTIVGFIPASILFAIIHVRYLSQWYLTINVILLSFGIGWLFDWTGNLAVVIMMHFTIDFLLGLAIRHKQNKNEL
ncbi:CPBP family intramembrane glutamic endopeptidase [Bacillus sp. PK3_68]|uniref:CPBP family intramembrane glutamic endopeptidase n=1 Tax=Bacillus sp. PK3_68 TaxID=2027408 RepID=UPI000E70E9C7|nr:CPBP family intramembrane glutamic endopeptidase [Bacillus sp. PK3_68]RJS59579.1 CPBP family intramembrane metalloprotease [Bacillus sp. PK3_68]